jgi:hypothetical protein
MFLAKHKQYTLNIYVKQTVMYVLMCYPSRIYKSLLCSNSFMDGVSQNVLHYVGKVL